MKKTLVSLSFKLPVFVEQKVNEYIIAHGYGMRGKSKWIREAIVSLLSFSNYPELVSLSDQPIGKNKTVTVRIPQSLLLKLEQSAIEVRKEYPILDGIKSKIVRTAILQKIIRNK